VVLEARGPGGAVVPYLPNERWVDGSLFGDLPKLRLARLHNVNHFIVSQTNPHVVPFRRLESHDAVGAVAGAAVAAARTQGVYAADVARRIAPAWSGPVQRLADRAYALASQEYGGDVDIHPRFRPELLGKMVVNPSRTDLAAFILEGQRATWPKLGLVRAQTRIGRVFRECVTALGGSPG
jgi:NTE family protein